MKRMQSRRRVRGISLIEVLISMAIGLVVIGAVIVSYLGSGRAGRFQSAYSQMDQDAQIGLNVLSRELQLAGYSQPSSLTPNAAGQLVMNYNIGAATAVFGCDKGFVDPKAATLVCDTGAGTIPTIEVVYEADVKNTVPTSAGIPTDCIGNGLNPLVPSVPTPILPLVAGLAVPPPYIVHNRYFVQTGPSGRPELYCVGTVRGGGATTNSVQPLLENVESMKLWYGVQVAANPRQVVRYVTATDINGVGAPEWANVISVRVCLLMRSADPVLSAEDTRTYLDCDSTTQTSSDNYLRRAYFTTTALRSKMAF